MSKGTKILRGAIDLILLLSIVFIGGLTIRSAMDSARSQSELSYAVAEAQVLYDGLIRYRERNHAFPNSYADPRFEPDTFEPLRRKGYYDGGISTVLHSGRVDAYDSPDDQGLNHEFWIEMTLASDSSVRLLVARSDDAPLSDGEWVEGVFVYRAGELEAH